MQIPVAGSQHAPWPGMHGSGTHVAEDVGMPPASEHSAPSTSTHDPAVGQQQAMLLLAHPPASGQVRFGKNCPPSCEQMFALVCTQVLPVPALLGTQQAPKKLLDAPVGQTAGLQLATQMPPNWVRHSHCVGTLTHPLMVQHCPPGRHGLGTHEDGLVRIMPLHGVPRAMSPQLPAASQHTTIGHGFGLHDVAVLGTPPGNGHGTAVEHAPVCGSQQTDSGGHGLGLHVEPAYATLPVGQLVLAKIVAHSPVAVSQQAVTHGFGVHTPLGKNTPPWQLASVLVWHRTVPGMQHAPVTGMPLHG